MSQSFRSTCNLLWAALLMVLFVSGCSEEPTQTFYDKSAASLPAPTITTVSPAGAAVAGIDTVTVQGTGFSLTPDENTVVFNAQPAPVISATSTELKIIAPLLVNDSVVIRVAVRGAYDFSNKHRYMLKAAVAKFGDLAANEMPTALATDAAGNIFMGLNANGIENGVLKFDPAGVRTVYAPKIGGDWSGLKMGRDGGLYGVRLARAIYRFAPGGGSTAAAWAQVVGATFTDCDFDQSGNLWAGTTTAVGYSTNLYRFAPDKSSLAVPFAGNVHSLRVYAGYLYFAANTSAGGEQIWRAQITQAGLGAPEVYFDFASAFPPPKPDSAIVPQAITFSADGDLYIGVNTEKGLVVVTPAKNYSTPLVVYKQLFGKGVKAIAWGKTNDIYCSTMSGLLLKINVTGKTSAPYYGNGL